MYLFLEKVSPAIPDYLFWLVACSWIPFPIPSSSLTTML